MAAPVFKLPAEFMAQHKAVLEAWDWARRPEMPLSAAVPDAGFADTDVLEAIGRGRDTIIRSKSPATMLRLRAYARTLEAILPLTLLNGSGADTAEVLKHRNAATEETAPDKPLSRDEINAILNPERPE